MDRNLDVFPVKVEAHRSWVTAYGDWACEAAQADEAGEFFLEGLGDALTPISEVLDVTKPLSWSPCSGSSRFWDPGVILVIG